MPISFSKPTINRKLDGLDGGGKSMDAFTQARVAIEADHLPRIQAAREEGYSGNWVDFVESTRACKADYEVDDVSFLRPAPVRLPPCWIVLSGEM